MSKVHTYRGYCIARGSFCGTSENCANRWYADAENAAWFDRRGAGFRTLDDAKAWIDDTIALRALAASMRRNAA